MATISRAKRDELVRLAGGDEALVDEFLKAASKRTEALELEGVSFKGSPLTAGVWAALGKLAAATTERREKTLHVLDRKYKSRKGARASAAEKGKVGIHG